MKALIYHDQRNLQLEDIPIPEPTENQVLIKVTDAGICQTQINEFMEGPFIINKDAHPLTGKAIPLTVGHEFGGIVESVGANVSDKYVDKQVAVLPLLSCGECRYCKKQQENLCDQFAYYGLLGENGGFAEYAVINQENVFPVDDPDLLTFVEPLLVGIHAAAQSKGNLKGKKVLVLGAGTLGIALAAIWKFYYEVDIYINDILSYRQEKARIAGFKTLSKDETPSDFDIVVDAAGSDPLSQQAALFEAYNYMLKGGDLIGIGTYFHSVAFVPTPLMVSEKNTLQSFAYNSQDVQELKAAIQVIDLNFSTFIETVPLEDIIEKGYFRAEVDRNSFARLVVKC